jgi:hypothetical protein
MQKLMVTSAVLIAGTVGAVGAENPRLGFQPAGQGYYSFDTGQFRGKVRVDGQSQGISSVVYVPTGMEMANAPGLLSYYRVFSTSVRYGEAVRDWPVVARLGEGRGLEIRFPPTAQHPMEITGTFRWRSADTLDLETTVKAAQALPRLEVFLSSYFADGFDALIYVKRNLYGEGSPAELLPADCSKLLDGNYLMFPRDDQSLRMIYDGRWNIPPNPVTWAFVRHLAAPIAVRRHAKSGLTAVLISPPDDCFAVGTPYNKQPPDGVGAHRSLYLSLFGHDLAAGKTAHARCRLILAKDLSDEEILERYRQFMAVKPVTDAFSDHAH